MSESQVHVVKIGGSLLELCDLPERLDRWRAGRSTIHDVLVVGGGKSVDAVRTWHSNREIDDETAHWTSIGIMGVNTRLLAADLPETRRLEPTLSNRAERDEPGSSFVDVDDFMRSVEPQAPGCKLPATWDVTGDSIAGRLAIVLKADHLVLLKSALPGEVVRDDLTALADEGYVDRFFPQLGAELPPVTLCDFRSEPPDAIRLSWQSSRGRSPY